MEHRKTDKRRSCLDGVVRPACADCVRLVLGHATAVITLRIYAHLCSGEEDRTRSVMDAVLGGMRTECGPVDQTVKITAGQKD